MSDLIRDYLLDTGDSDILYIAKQEAAKEMERRKILERHAKHFSIRLITEKGRKPRYETFVYSDGKRKPLRRKTKEELEDAIIEFYEPTSRSGDYITSINSLYNDWRSYRIATKSPSTVHKDDWTWKRYYEDTEFSKRDVELLSVHDITIWLMERVKEHKLSQRQFREMKSLLNNILDFAVDKNIIARNLAREIHGISLQLFELEEQPGKESQIFERDDQKSIVEYCWSMYVKTDSAIYLGIILNFLMGVRIGELSAIKFSDIDASNNVLKLQRSEVSDKIDKSGKMVSCGTHIVPFLKRGHRSRPVPLSNMALGIIDFIRDSYAKKGWDTEWLILNKNGERATKSAISNTLRRVNESLNLPAKGNHAIRKTVITEMIQSMMFTQKEIQTYFGHKDFSTTSRYYDFAINDVTENANKMNDVLGTELSNWVTFG